MKTELIVESFENKELPSYKETARITSCENRFEIIISSQEKLTSWDNWLLQGKLAKWLQSRMDSKNPGGHNPPNSIP